MPKQHIFPEEIRGLIDTLLRESLGNEGEGSNPIGEIERILREHGKIESEAFGRHFPKINPDTKAKIAIMFLYDVGLDKLGLDLNPPQMRPDSNGVYKLVPTIKHLEQLHRIWTILVKLGNEKNIFI